MMLHPHLGQLPAGYSIAGYCPSPMTNPPDSSSQVWVAGPGGFAQCMTDNQLSTLFPVTPGTATPAANYIPNQAPDSGTSPAAQAAQSAIASATTAQSTAPVQNAVQTSSNPLSSAGIVATDGSAFLTTDYGPLPLWGWLAAGAAALFLIGKK